MSFASTFRNMNSHFKNRSTTTFLRPLRLVLGAGISVIVMFSSGCQTQTPVADVQATMSPQKPEALTLREGDVIKITVPSAPNLDTVQTIRRDGRIALALIGEVQVAGLKPAEIQAELVKRYASQILSKEVEVSVVSSSFPVFVTGAVLKSGKIITDHPITALEAIMEAGGPDYAKANLKAVVIIRQEAEGKTQNYTLNLKLVIEGKQSEPFYLKPADIVYVPEAFTLF
jgi:polysaccharide export outer membrane protein